MKTIITVEEARARLQISQEIEPASLVANIESAVSAAQQQVQSVLECDFTETTGVTNVFFLDKDSFSNVRPEGVFRLYLPTGFIKTGTVALLYGDAWNNCTEEVPTEDYEVDYVRGVIRVDEYYADKFVKVTYNHGVTAATAPAWLKEALLAFVPVMFHLPSVNSKADPGVNMKELKEHADTVLNGHLRKATFCIRAMR